MTTMLRTRLAYESDETALSLLGRLAAVETGQQVNRILADLSVDRIGFLVGRPGPVRDFATAIGMDSAMLLDGAFQVLPRETVFRGEGLSKDFADSWVRKVCLHCLRDDGERKAWRHRLLWCFRVAQSCPIHNVRLIDLDDGKAADIRTLQVSKALDWQMQVPGDSVRTPRYLDWLDHRIARRDGHDDWTDGQTLEQVLAASEVLGAVLDHGHGVRLHSLTASERGTALERGFEIYVGETSIDPLCHRRHSRPCRNEGCAGRSPRDVRPPVRLAGDSLELHRSRSDPRHRARPHRRAFGSRPRRERAWPSRHGASLSLSWKPRRCDRSDAPAPVLAAAEARIRR